MTKRPVFRANPRVSGAEEMDALGDPFVEACQQLATHPDVVGTGWGIPVRRDAKGKDRQLRSQRAILIFVREKTDDGSKRRGPELPRFINGLPTDVVTAPNARLMTLEAGDSGGRFGDPARDGTITALAADATGQCWALLSGHSTLPQYGAYQSGLVAFVTEGAVNVAVTRVEGRFDADYDWAIGVVATSGFSAYGALTGKTPFRVAAWSANQAVFSRSRRLAKNVRGLVTGMVPVSVPLPGGGTTTLNGVLQVEGNVAVPGDSGGLFQDGDGAAVGVLVAADVDRGLAYLRPISDFSDVVPNSKLYFR